MVKEKALLEIAVDNRYKCTACGSTIYKEDKYFRDASQGWRHSHTVNLCMDCIVKMFIDLDFTSKIPFNKKYQERRKMVLAREIIKSRKCFK